jgi:hypothetical protein
MSAAMSIQDELNYEARSRGRQTAVAAAAGVLVLAAAIVQLTGPHTKVSELTLDLITEHKRFPLDLIGAIVNGFGLGLIAWTLWYLFRITQARNPELKDFMRWLAIAGGLLSAVSAVIYSLVIAHAASNFVNHGTQTYVEAHHLTSTGAVVALPLLAQLASLVLTAGFVMIALNAMRVGLLTRFMGYLGIFAGVLVLFPIGSPVPVVQGFWLLALAYLLSGRWPNGVPASWSTGQIEKWPTSAELREQRDKERGVTRKPKSTAKPKASQPAAKAESEAETTTATAPPSPAPGRTRSTTPKRKRKRRS